MVELFLIMGATWFLLMAFALIMHELFESKP